MNDSCSVLIIDDNPDDVFIAKRAIAKSRPDCDIQEAYDGLAAMEYLSNGRPPALILLDLKMPGIGGIEILNLIRAREETRYIPVVILSSSKMEQDVKTSFKSGANSFLHKTHDMTEFTEMLRMTLHYWMDLNLSPA